MKTGDFKQIKPQGYLPFPSHLIYYEAKDSFCVKAIGKGMLPTIKSGDYLMCTKTDCLVTGDIAILYNGKDIHCKYYIESFNGAVYQNSLFEVFDASDYWVIGKVVSKYGLIK